MLKEKRSFLDKFTNARDEEQAITQPRSMPVYSEDEETQMTVDHSEEVMQEQQNVMPQQTWQEEPESDDIEGQLTIDVYQTENDIVIKSTIAGVKPENLDVGINNDMITIKGDRVNEEEVTDDNYYYQECY